MLLPKKPVQGIWGMIEKMLEKYGALNKKYDSNLDGIVDNADKVDGHDAGTSAGNVLVLDTAGQVPLGNLPLLPASQLGFSFGWELVGSISSSGVSSIEFTGLDGDTDKLYMLIIAAYNTTSTTTGFCARFNADTTLAHYGWIAWKNEAGTTSTTYQGFGATAGQSGVLIGNLTAHAKGLFQIIIHPEGISDGTNTYVFCVSKGFNTDAIRYGNYGGGWIKQASVSSIQIYTVAAVAFDWIAYLFKAKW